MIASNKMNMFKRYKSINEVHLVSFQIMQYKNSYIA